MQITRWNPFIEMDEMQQRLNRLFMERTGRTADEGITAFTPPVDIEETETAFIVKADLPDMKKEEVKVHLHEGVLAIEGERRREKETGNRFHRIERDYGKFVRRFAMPTDIDSDKVHAEFKDGVLQVTLPKAPAAKTTQVDIKVL